MDMFFSNDAFYPIAKYQQEQINDREIHYSKWKKRRNPSSHPPIFDRLVTFIHPLKNTIGPSQAKTTRQQSFQRFGNHGMCLQNVTMVEGVPAAECFRVEDRWNIEGDVSSDSDSNDSSVKMRVSFQAVFTKRTMFKSIIQKNIRQESKTWAKGYVHFVHQALAEDRRKDADAPPLPPLSACPIDEANQQGTPSSDSSRDGRNYKAMSTLDLILRASAVLILLGLAFQIYGLQQTVMSLQNQMLLTQKQNNELLVAMQKML
jgi:hypothetical protein